jgi:hypothetical protein
MEKSNLIEICNKSLKKYKYIYLSEKEFSLLNENIINKILNKFSGKCMIRLPESEIIFFEWLKENDFTVWNDIWNDSNNELNTEPYLVSINLLPVIMNLDGRGLPICDLKTTDNYYFTLNNMLDKESKILIEASQELFKKNKSLTPAQMLALEISLDPIDMWHFAYKHKISLDIAKEAVNSLVADNALVHLREAEHIAPFIHF